MMKYDLHDSLIEKVIYFADERRLEMKIELCNWQQNGYKDSDPEMRNICIAFEGVEKYELSVGNYEFNSDEILDVVEIDNKTIKIVFLTENDAETLIVASEQIKYL